MRVGTILPFKKQEWNLMIIQALPCYWEKHIASLDEEITINYKELYEELKHFNKDLDYIYKDFDWGMKEEDVKHQEHKLGTSFNLILTAYKQEYTKTNYIYLANLVKFWFNFFTVYDIELFIGRMESFPNDYVSMLVCKKLNIKFVSFCVKFLNNVLLIDEHGIPIFWKEPSKKEITKAVDYFETQTSNFNKTFQEVNQKKTLDYEGRINDIYEKVFMSKGRQQECTPLMKSIMKPIEGLYKQILIHKYYNDIPEDYFYYILHYKYETFLYREYWYFDQYQLLFETLKCTPLYTNIVFRNHPAFKGSDADFSMLNKIMQLPNAKYASLNLSSKELVMNSKGIISIFSTALLEAIILRKPSIVLFDKGYYVEGVNIFVDDIKQLPEAIKLMSSGKFRINETKRKNYLGKLYKHFIPLNGSITRFGPDFTVDGCIGIANAIVDLSQFDIRR
jgi:hypothetical protein